MNKKNVIMLSIAAALLANCAVAMEKKKLGEITIESGKVINSLIELSKLPYKNSLYISFINTENKTLVKELNLLFMGVAARRNVIECLKIKLDSSKISLDGANWESQKNLKQLYFNAANMSYVTVNKIFKNNPQLSVLDLWCSKGIAWEKVEWKYLKNLVWLDLSYTKITTEAINQIIRNNDQLKNLKLVDAKNILCDNLYLEGMKNIESMDLSFITNLSTKNMDQILKKLPKLNRIHLTKNYNKNSPLNLTEVNWRNSKSLKYLIYGSPDKRKLIPIKGLLWDHRFLIEKGFLPCW